MRTHGVVSGLLLTALFLPAGFSPAAAQDQAAFGPVAISLSAGRHQLGAGLELMLTTGIGLTARAEGLPDARRRALGGGVRVNLVRDQAVSVYAAALGGAVSCGNPLLENGDLCADTEWRKAVYGGAGLELLLTEQRTWSAGVEAGYWAADERDGGVEALDHWTFAATLRWRPH